MTHASRESSVELYWIPLGAGGHSVRVNGKVFEALDAARTRRPRCDLYHAALIVTFDGDRHTIELAPAWGNDEKSRGVVATGAVGSRHLGWCPLFRYELRCWPGGAIPDLQYAVGGARRLEADRAAAGRVLDGAARVPTPVWGRDELAAGEMWNCNSVVAWLIATAGIATDAIRPPPGGRAPGWDAGIAVASRRDVEIERPALGVPNSGRCAAAPLRHETAAPGAAGGAVSTRARPSRRPWG